MITDLPLVLRFALAAGVAWLLAPFVPARSYVGLAAVLIPVGLLAAIAVFFTLPAAERDTLRRFALRPLEKPSRFVNRRIQAKRQ